MKNIKCIKSYLNENVKEDTQLRINRDDNKFKLYVNDILVSETGFNIELPDKWFSEIYLTLNDLKTFEEFQGKGYATYLLEKIFDYIKNVAKLNIITLIVDKDNSKAINLYSKVGFKIYQDYKDSYCLVIRL